MLLAAGAASSGTIYKWVDAQGTIHYSSQPTPGATELQIDSAPPQGASPASVPVPATASAAAAAEPFKYTSCALTKPTNDEALPNAFSVSVAWRVEPALRPGDRWLAQQAVVQIAPSLSILPSLARRVGASRAALLIGCSSFGGRALDLPCVTDELAAIAAELTDRHVELRDAQARRAALIDRGRSGDLAAYGLLHIASHAQMLPSRGLAAHIKLWDDDLWLPEIAALRLSGGIVILSACEGAAAEALPGEELLSLSWAFLAAGAGGVIASLRSVYDRPTIALMRQLYIALGAHGDAAAALAEAQRALIDAGEIVEGVAVEPHHWASFVAIGMGSLPS